MSKPTTVLLVDDHALLRETLGQRLEQEMDIEVVGLAENADQAVQLAEKTRPNVVVMDVDMPGRVSFDAAREIQRLCESARLVFLSAFFTDSYIEDALAAGALSYLTKDEPADAVVDAIRQAREGVASFSPKVRERLVVKPDQGVSLKQPADTRIATLTEREREVLRYLAKGMTKKRSPNCCTEATAPSTNTPST